MSFDIIGDIHGYVEPLYTLLNKLGYSIQNGYYKHPTRQVIFVGDFIDGGPSQAELINTVKSMCDNDAALAIMGNHEFNALAYHTEHPHIAGNYLRHRNNKNTYQHLAFLNEYLHKPDELKSVLNWFKTLPMWLELDKLRIIHACWDDKSIEFIKSNYSDNGLLSDELLHLACEYGTDEFFHVETILKGKEITLPDGECFFDKSGTRRDNIRVRWWDNTATTYQQAYMGPENSRQFVTTKAIDVKHLVQYHPSEPPVFLGHYWLDGKPERLGKNIACTDYSIAKPGGKLVAYQWDGELIIDNEKFVMVES